ncbi:MAG: hypothetical protein U1E28_06005 [Beijerinckiaceae bacterium]
MPETAILAEARARSAAAGLGPQDMIWLDRLGWKDSAVPEIGNADHYADYRRREKLLNAAVAHLSFAERADSPEGRLAAAIGARIADWRDAADARDD